MTWLDGVLMLVLFATLGWWIDDGVGGMFRKTRHLFRRAPAHLRGRVPVDCGVGQVAKDITPPLRTQEEWYVHCAARHWVRGETEEAEDRLAKANHLAASRGAAVWVFRESLKGSCRPAPAENARRYTQEEATW